MRMFSADHPHQPTQPRLVQVGDARRPAPSGHSWSRDTDEAARPACPAARGRCAPDDGRTPGRGPHTAHPASPFGGPVSDDHTNEFAVQQVRPSCSALARWSACCGQHMVVHCAPCDFNASVNLVASSIRGIGSADQQPFSCVGVGTRRAALAAAIRWSAAARPAHRSRVAALGDPGTHSQPRTVSRTVPCSSRTSRSASTACGVGSGHPRVAVAGVARRTVGAQPAHTQRQQQAAAACALDVRMSHDRLETGIQQSRVNAVGGLLGADRTGQPDLGQHGAVILVGPCARRPDP